MALKGEANNVCAHRLFALTISQSEHTERVAGMRRLEQDDQYVSGGLVYTTPRSVYRVNVLVSARTCQPTLALSHDVLPL